MWIPGAAGGLGSEPGDVPAPDRRGEVEHPLRGSAAAVDEDDGGARLVEWGAGAENPRAGVRIAGRGPGVRRGTGIVVHSVARVRGFAWKVPGG